MGLEHTIQNVGEYFSAHYLAGKEGFNKDIGEHVKRWKDQGSQSTPRKLQALGEAFFAAKSEALDYPEPELRSKAINQGNTKELHRWHPLLLQALGYPQEPTAIALDTEQKHLPALLRLHRHSQAWLAVLQAPFCLNSGDYTEEALEEFVEATPATEQNEQTTPPLQCEWEKAIALLFKQEDRPRWAILLAGSKIYLFDAHTYAQGRYIYIDLDAAYSSKDKNAFDAIAALLSHECLAPSTDTDEVLHEKLREGSLKQTHAVSESLQGAVREAIELIANGWIEQRRTQSRGYKQLGEREQPLPDGSREVTAEQLKHDALVYVYRILFCLYAEARGGELGVLPITDDVYRLGYSLEALRDLADMGEPGTQSEDGSYYAEHLNRLFQLVHEGFHPDEAEVKEQAEGSNAWLIQLPEQNELFGSTTKQLSLNKSGRKQLATGNSKTFVIQPLTATLFAPNATPLLNRVQLSNRVLHQVIRRLSLGTGSKSKQIGRINYAELGIVQLGSVYEGLLSYKGFFAKENLIQVVKAGRAKKVKGKNEIPTVFDDAINPKEPSWFVPEQRLGDFKEGEVVIERRTKQPRIYRQGEFILHLNGVDRVNSASYYTPEVLTRALVKEALKERLKDFGPEQADDILQLKICEPAMGSAAFLVEAIDKLARHYLVLKQEQIGEQIDPSRFEEELGRVKHYIAVHNVYGVDLNPTAVELGALSLWLASIHSLRVQEGENGSADIYRPGQTPWFGLRLRAGNSLIGARRAVWTYDQLATGKHYGKKALAPRQLKPGEQRNEKEIYHFLVWDEDMAPAARDKLMKSHWQDECAAINEWNKKQIKQNWSPEELAQARDICQKIDELWQDYAQHRAVGIEQTECTASVWPVPANSTQALKPGPSLEYQEQVKANLEAQSGAFQRLKLLMDSWCSFYFWPLERSEDLPSRAAWLSAAEVLLGCDAVEKEQARANLDFTLGDNIQLEALFAESQQQLPDASNLAAAVPWFRVAREVNSSQNFHHWELIFTEVLGPKFDKQAAEPKGFDLMFGNPPWLVVAWNPRVHLAEWEPLISVRELDSIFIPGYLENVFTSEDEADFYCTSFESYCGISTALKNRKTYPLLSGSSSNLYKNFLERCWSLINSRSSVAMIHLKGSFDDAGGIIFRGEFYSRLQSLSSFRNELKLFRDIHHGKEFELTITGEIKSKIEFEATFQLFHPVALADCSQKSLENLPIPGIKNEEGRWQTRGHPKRTIIIDENVLDIFSKLASSGEKGGCPPLLQVHNKSMLHIIEAFIHYGENLSRYKSGYDHDTMFHEKNSKNKGILHRCEDPSFQPTTPYELILAGPHFSIANPFAKTARTTCTNNTSYDSLDLTSLPFDYLPASPNSPGDKNGCLDSFIRTINLWPESSSLKQVKESVSADSESKIIRVEEITVAGNEIRLYEKCADFDQEVSPPRLTTSRFRYVNRRMVDLMTSRTLLSTVYPPGVTHTDGIFSLIFEDEYELLKFSGATCSLLYDLLVRFIGKTNVGIGLVGQLPLPLSSETVKLIVNRFLRLICLTVHYDSLWENNFQTIKDSFVRDIPLNEKEKRWNDLTTSKCQNVALRSDFSRRQALLEIDVLVAIELDVKLIDLIRIYETQFPIFLKYENVDLYDQKGRRLPITERKDAGAKELREALKNHDGQSPITVSWEIDNGLQAVTKTFYPPFTHVDRIEDYKTAYRVFSERLGLNDKSETME